MQSPLEHDPELVALLGLITVRWSALEDALADLVGSMMAVNDIGHTVIYSMSAFSQRLSFTSALLRGSLANERDIKVAEKLLNKVGDLWISRNHLSHSHYVHRTEYHNGMCITLTQEDGFGIRPESIEDKSEKAKSRTFGYLKHSRGQQKFVPVNKGSLKNHAASLLRRGRQILVLTKAIDTRVAPLREVDLVSHRQPSPRSPFFKGVVAKGAHIKRAPRPI